MESDGSERQLKWKGAQAEAMCAAKFAFTYLIIFPPVMLKNQSQPVLTEDSRSLSQLFWAAAPKACLS